jgi:transcriptional regulator GlxA family with amidase domain
MTRSALARDVLVVAFPDFQMLDVTGPVEVFSIATRYLEATGREGGYRTSVVGTARGPLVASSGLALVTAPLPSLPRRTDTLITVGGRGTRQAVHDAALVAFLARAAKGSRRIASVCTGAFLLARAGLLRGKRATTHWDSAAALAARHPEITVEPDRIFVKDGSTYTSAGVTAGIDLALALVAEDHGRALSLEVARQLVVFLQRPGGQSQFSAQLAVQVTDREPLSELCAFIEENLCRDLTVPALAKHAGMSPRNFARRFTEALGTTPARYVAAARLSAARRRLEETSQGIERVAEDAGFGTVESLRRAFVATLGTTPSEYRDRFGKMKGAAA